MMGSPHVGLIAGASYQRSAPLVGRFGTRVRSPDGKILRKHGIFRATVGFWRQSRPEVIAIK
jgi:hypothetical protein